MRKRINYLRILAVVVCFVLMSSMVFGCGTKPASTTPSTPAEKTADGKIKLTFWYAVSSTSGEVFKKQIEAFNASQNKIFVETVYSGSYADTATKVSAAFESHTEPNGALMAAAPLYTGGRNNYWMDEQVNKDKDFNKDDIYEGMWEYCKYNGKICALPYGISTPVLYYNKSILEAAGIDMTKEPKSWDELLALAQKAQKDGNKNKSADFWGFDVSDAPWLFKAMLKQNGNNIVDVKDNKVTPAFDSESGIAVASLWKKFVDEKVMPQYQHDLAEKKFLAGNLAFMVASSTRIQKWASNKEFQIGAFPLPYIKEASVPLGGNALVVFNKNNEADDACWQLEKYLMSAENNGQFALSTGYLPVRKSALSLPEAKKAISDNPLYQIAFNQLKSSWSYWHFDAMGTMDQLLGSTLEKIEKNVAAPDKAMKECAASLKKEME